MTTVPETLGVAYFDGMYQAAADPWGFEERWYERRKYAIALAMLPAERYRAAFEPGCSIGVLTAMLAPRCGTLLACDLAAAAVKAAAGRTSDLPRSESSGGRSPGSGRLAASTSSCCPRSCTTSATTTWNRS